MWQLGETKIARKMYLLRKSCNYEIQESRNCEIWGYFVRDNLNWVVTTLKNEVAFTRKILYKFAIMRNSRICKKAAIMRNEYKIVTYIDALIEIKAQLWEIKSPWRLFNTCIFILKWQGCFKEFVCFNCFVHEKSMGSKNKPIGPHWLSVLNKCHGNVHVLQGSI